MRLRRMIRLLLALSLDCLLAQAPGTQKWATQVGTLKNKGTTDSSPCLSPDGSLVFVGGNDRPELFFHAINTNDGAFAWNFSLGNVGMQSSPITHDDTVYLARRDGVVFALRMADGTQRWNTTFSQFGLRTIYATPAISHDGALLYIATDGMYQPHVRGAEQAVYAIRTADGSQVWNFTGPYPFHGSPVLSPDGTALYIGGADQGFTPNASADCVYALNAATGAKLWRFVAPGGVTMRPAVSHDGSTIYVGASLARPGFGIMLAIDASSGTKKWSYEPDGAVSAILSPTLAPDGATLYVGTWNVEHEALTAINTADGSKKWAFVPDVLHGGAAIETSPVLSLDGRTVYAGSDSPLLYAIDASNGTLVWQFQAKHSQAGAFWSSSATISADGKTLYASHQDDYLYAIWT